MYARGYTYPPHKITIHLALLLSNARKHKKCGPGVYIAL